MDKNNKKCSSKDHDNMNAIQYCYNCKIYLCKKCETHHSILFQNHNLYSLDKEMTDIFTGYCTKEGHNEILEFYCKTHNELCCVSCLCVLKDKGKGQHSTCEICHLEDIKDDKKNKLKNNINILQELSIKMEESIKHLKNVYNKINARKEKINKKYMDIFTKLRNALNQREDEILNDIDNEFQKYFFNEDLIKKVEKLPNKVKISLEKGKIINDEWNDKNKLNLIINNCIEVENSIRDIKIINTNMEKYKQSEGNIHINYEIKDYNDEINYILDIIKYVCKDDELNIYTKIKNIEKENLELKERLNKHLFFLQLYLPKIKFAFLSRVNETMSLDTICSRPSVPHLWEFSETNANQIFTLIKNEDGTYFIKNNRYDLFLGMENQNEEWKLETNQKGHNYQKFKLIHLEKDYFLIQNEKGKYIDLINNEAKNFGVIRPNDKKDSLGQQWKLLII